LLFIQIAGWYFIKNMGQSAFERNEENAWAIFFQTCNAL
jgi:hypothetical protein